MLAAQPPPCRTAQLHAHAGLGGGAAGTAYTSLVLANSGPACRLRGYPGVSSVGGADGHQVGAPAARAPGPRPTVVLPTGGAARAVYGQAQALNYPKAR